MSKRVEEQKMAKEILDKIHTNPEIAPYRNNPRLFSKLKIYMGGNIETKYKEIVVEENVKYE